MAEIQWAREPRNGRPFYCKTCGAGFGEFMACEMPDCELESEDDAKRRASQSDAEVKP